MAEEKEEIIKEANKEVEEILSDEEMKALEEYRQTAIWDERDRIAYAEKKAREKGEKEGQKIGQKIGEQIGKEIGEQIGKEIGKEIGQKQEKIEIAKKMLKEDMTIEQISKITELSKDEIEALAQSFLGTPPKNSSPNLKN